MKNSFLLISFLISSLIGKAQSLEFAKKMGGFTGEGGVDIGVDTSGNIYTLGRFEGTTDFDPDSGIFNLTCYGEWDMYISKLDASGNFLWAKQLGGSKYDIAESIGVDASGNSYIIGRLNYTVDFDPGPGTFYLSPYDDRQNSDLFILKLDQLGNFVWAKKIEGPETIIGQSITLDEYGNIYTTGHYNGKVDFDPDSSRVNYLTSVGSTSSNVFILKLNANGEFIWVKSLGGAGTDLGYDIAVDNSGNVLTTGRFNNTVDFDPGAGIFNLTSNGFNDIFISKLDSMGNLLWAKSFGDKDYDVGNYIAIDNLGNTYVTGFYKGIIDFDPNPSKIFYLNSERSPSFILKLDKSGSFLWAKNLADSIACMSLEVDYSGNLYYAGCFNSIVDFDPNIGKSNIASEGGNDIFISKLDTLGHFVWAKGMGGKLNESASSICLDAYGNVYATGGFNGIMDFDPNVGSFNLTSSGMSDVFILKLNQDSCSNMSLVIDSIKDISCYDNVAYASGYGLHGKAPYSYVWNTVIPIKDSIATFTFSGFYSLKITAANNCFRETSILIHGPTSNSGFDLNTNFVAVPFRPGRKSMITAVELNDGCRPISGKLLVVLDQYTKYSDASPKPNNIKGDTLIWDFKTLKNGMIGLKLSIEVITDPNTAFEDTVCFDVIITPINEDINPFNNIKRYCYPIRNSYDPNIKSVYPPGACQQGYVLKNKPLTYTVQFQNTGNAEAIDIYILDTLDPHLDIKSLRVIGQSHKAPITEILPGRVLKLRFDNINLPDSFSNEKRSHGYVIYEVMPDSTVSNGTTVMGKAGIYFDFNPPVFTNTVKNTLTNSIPGCTSAISNPEFSKHVHIYPNPNNGNFTVEMENPEKGDYIEVYSLVGERVKRIEKIEKITIINLDFSAERHGVANGIYFIRTKNGREVWNQKVLVGAETNR